MCSLRGPAGHLCVSLFRACDLVFAVPQKVFLLWQLWICVTGMITREKQNGELLETQSTGTLQRCFEVWYRFSSSLTSALFTSQLRGQWRTHPVRASPRPPISAHIPSNNVHKLDPGQFSFPLIELLCWLPFMSFPLSLHSPCQHPAGVTLILSKLWTAVCVCVGEGYRCVCGCVREMCVPCVQHLWLLAVGDDSVLCHGLFPLSSSIKVRSTPKRLHTKREGSGSFAIRREPITSNNTELIWQETHPVTSTGVSARILCPWNRFSCWCVLAGRLNVWQPTWYSTHKDSVYT